MRSADAVALLTAANRMEPAVETAEAMVRYRHRAALAVPAASPPIPATEPVTAAEWRDRIDRALDAFDAGLGGAPIAETTPWYRPFRAEGDSYRIGGRKWMRESGGVWSVDCPHLLGEVCAVIEETGIVDLVTRISASARCSRPTSAICDGYRRPRRATGIREAAADGVAVIRPEFGPGDALLFDHLYSTYERPSDIEDALRERYPSCLMTERIINPSWCDG